MSYTKVNWENIPSKGTPMSAENLNHMDDGIADVDYNLAIARSDLVTLTGRVDELAQAPEGSTTGDLELIDGRTDAYGDTYTNIGGAMRAQFSKAANNVAEAYLTTETYNYGDYVTYKGALMKCIGYDVTGTWDATKWEAVSATDYLAVAEDSLTRKADINGNHSDLTSGTAKQLLSKAYTTDNEPYMFRQSRATGDRSSEVIVGGSVVWNQLVNKSKFINTSATNVTVTPNGDGSITVAIAEDITDAVDIILTTNNGSSYFNVPVGHKYMIYDTNVRPGTTTYKDAYQGAGIGWNYIREKSSNSTRILLAVRLQDVTAGTYTIAPQIFDLTMMFGANIANYLATLTTMAERVAWFSKYFPDDYYAYNAGEIKNIAGLAGHVTVGFNQWDEEWEVGDINTTTGEDTTALDRIRSKNYIPVKSSTEYYLKSPYNCIVIFYDAEKNCVGSSASFHDNTFNTTKHTYYIRFFAGSFYGNTYHHDICINLSDPAKNGTYEQYVKHTYPLDDSLTLRGIPKLDSNNKLYFNGDIYEPDGTVTRRYGVMVLNGTTNTFTNALGVTSNGFAVYKTFPRGRTINTLCNRFTVDTGNGYTTMSTMTYVGNSGVETTWTFILPSSVTSLQEANAWLVNNPTTIIYALVNSTTEQSTPYTEIQTVDPNGTEEFVFDDNAFKMPVGHETKYYTDLRAKLEDLTIDSTLSNEGEVADAKAVSDALQDLHESLASVTTVTLTSDNWASYSQTATVTGILADETKQIISVYPSEASKNEYVRCGVAAISQGTGSLTFSCVHVPTTNLTIYISITEVASDD